MKWAAVVLNGVGSVIPEEEVTPDHEVLRMLEPSDVYEMLLEVAKLTREMDELYSLMKPFALVTLAVMTQMNKVTHEFVCPSSVRDKIFKVSVDDREGADAKVHITLVDGPKSSDSVH